jgi:tRNA(Ile2) C34 agmatinyltransferase TiaS
MNCLECSEKMEKAGPDRYTCRKCGEVYEQLQLELEAVEGEEKRSL